MANDALLSHLDNNIDSLSQYGFLVLLRNGTIKFIKAEVTIGAKFGSVVKQPCFVLMIIVEGQVIDLVQQHDVRGYLTPKEKYYMSKHQLFDDYKFLADEDFRKTDSYLIYNFN